MLTDAVILAGGTGTRLRPFTVSIPKPLVPLGEEPIIEILLRQLAANGVTRVHLALGHLAPLMKAYFDQVSQRHEVEILYSFEDQPLGTIGPLRKIQGLGDTCLLINGDILTTLSFSELVKWHHAAGCIATFAVHGRTVSVDYGVIEVGSDGHLLSHKEKPSLEFTVGMGIYVFNRRIIDFIPVDQKFDLPDLVRLLIAKGEPIATYRSEDYWMDIGRPEDYEIAYRDYTSDPARFLGSRHTVRR
jgi:NDP-sugar pyrophosphorylase family protein